MRIIGDPEPRFHLGPQGDVGICQGNVGNLVDQPGFCIPTCDAFTGRDRENNVSLHHSTGNTFSCLVDTACVISKEDIKHIRKHSVSGHRLGGSHIDWSSKHNRGPPYCPTGEFLPSQCRRGSRFDEGFAVLDYLCIYQVSIVVELILFCMHKIGNGHQAKSTRSIRDDLRQYRQRRYAHQHNERERQRGYFFKPLIHWNSS